MALWISSDDDCLYLTEGHSRTAIDWADVQEIQTYKIDLWSYDVICLAFRVADQWYECSEEDHGFSELFQVLSLRYPSIDPDWYSRVMQPPFASNLRVLWKCAG
jgi:hypothetical protein